MHNPSQHQNHKHFRRRRRPSAVRTLQAKSVICHILPLACFLLSTSLGCQGQQTQQNYLMPSHNMENFHILESQPVDSVVYQLKAFDRFNEHRRFTYHMTGDHLRVDELTGEVRLVKPLDRELKPQLTVIVSVFDTSDTKSDLPVETKRRTIFVDDIDDSPPVFGPHKAAAASADLAVSLYQASVSELAPVGTLVLGDIQVSDADESQNADLVFECRAGHSTQSTCETFAIEHRRLSVGRYLLSVRTKAPLDFERTPSYRMAIGARGRRPSPLKGVPLETEAFLDIQLVNVQDEGPIFVNAPYSLSMNEGAKNGTRLLNLLVQDGDSAPQRELSVIVAPGQFSDFFRISKDREANNVWYLETNGVIDREEPQISRLGNMFNISLLAAELNDEGKPVASDAELWAALHEHSYARSSLRRENVTIVVLDVLDSRPTFVQASTGRAILDNVLVVNVSESIESGSSVPNLDLAVIDMDQGVNSRFSLRLNDADSGPAASAVFKLESEVIYGRSEVVLSVLNSSLLDYEEPSLRSYKFSLVAAKNEDPSFAHILEVQINLVDANDNSPEFERNQYILEVAEDAQPETLIGSIKATDKDSGVNGRLEYMLRGMGASKFKLLANEGKILLNDCGLAQCLDFEVQQTYSLTYEARDGGNRATNVSVLINIIDINDHAPKFSESLYRRELISDNLSSKQNYISPRLVVRARDGDGISSAKSNVTYRIKSSNLTGLDVDPISGLVYLSHPIDLDNLIANIERQNGNSRVSMSRVMFEAEIEAKDSGNPALTSSARVHLSVRGNGDGAPRFKQDSYQALVKESQPANRSFFQVQAVDPDEKDSQLRYSIGDDLNDLLQVNEQTGEISFKEPVEYEHFEGRAYNVTVYATDNSRPQPLKASALLSVSVLDVNNKPPKFEQPEYRATLVEAKSRPGDILLQLKATDADQGAQLNYSINLDQISVNVRNGLKFSVADLANLSSNVYLSQLNKADGVELSTQLRNLFAINRKTGSVELRSEPDYSLAASISIVVKVVDLAAQEFAYPAGEQADAVVCTFFLQRHVDKSPVFAPPWSIDRREYNISILEELAANSVVFSLLAKDPNDTSHKIEQFEKVPESDPSNLFRVDKSGVVYVNGRIDYEQLSEPKRLRLTVKAIGSDDDYSTATLNIQVVDINDNAPQFTSDSYEVQISESAQHPLELVKVHADDRDSAAFGQVYYSISSAYETQFFSIEPRKGSISLKRNAKLDRELEPVHSMLVSASDCNETSTSTSSGASQSGCRKSSVLVRVKLVDENDNQPSFTNVNKRGELESLISETVAVGTTIARAQAVDPDEGPNGQISYEIVASADEQIARLLAIDRDGYISVVDSFAGLGRPVPYKLVVRASDNGTQSRHSDASLLLTVADVVINDGVPKFVKPKLNEIVYLSEASGPSTFVYQVQAIDPDQENNGKILYKFLRPSEVFDIDPFEGIIRTQARPNLVLDRETVPHYNLIVIAQDLGSPPKQSQQVITIRLTDVNDNEPFFERGIDDEPLVLTVREELPRGALIASIRAVDRDIGQNALIGYEIISGDQANLFRLSYETSVADELSGLNNLCHIYTNGRLDREARESYQLTIKASSLSKLRGNPFMPTHQPYVDPLGGRNPFNQYNASDLSKIRVTIKLVDINDNRPIFSEQNTKSIVDSTAMTFSQLMGFKASDADASSSEMQYSLLDAYFYRGSKFPSANGVEQEATSAKHVFDVDSRSGILRNLVSLRPYTDGYFEVFVKADSGQYNSREDSESGSCASVPTFDNSTATATATATSTSDEIQKHNNQTKAFGEIENCSVAVSKGIVLVTQQRETFRFLFNATRLKNRMAEFELALSDAFGSLMFTAQRSDSGDYGTRALKPLAQSVMAEPSTRREKLLLNTFNTDFYEREDGSLDFKTLTSCSQLVKFDERPKESEHQSHTLASVDSVASWQQQVPTQVISYDQVLSLIKTLNQTQTRGQQASILSEFGVVGIERCLPSDRTQYRLSLPERVSIYLAIFIAVAGTLLAVIVSQMRKSYEKNLKLLQRSKYQFMSPGSIGAARMAPHHLSVASLQAAAGFMTHPYMTPTDYDGVPLNTWQL